MRRVCQEHSIFRFRIYGAGVSSGSGSKPVLKHATADGYCLPDILIFRRYRAVRYRYCKYYHNNIIYYVIWKPLFRVESATAAAGKIAYTETYDFLRVFFIFLIPQRHNNNFMYQRTHTIFMFSQSISRPSAAPGIFAVTGRRNNGRRGAHHTRVFSPRIRSCRVIYFFYFYFNTGARHYEW